MSRSLLLALCLTGSGFAQPLTSQDYVNSRYIREGFVQPGGASLIYTVTCETPSEARFDRRGVTASNDVWMFENGQARVLLDDAMEPGWSPDGKAVAVLDADEENARLKVWWQKNGRWSVLRRATVGAGSGRGYAWLPYNRLMVLTQVDPPAARAIRILDSEPLAVQPRHALLEWNPDSGSTREWAKGDFESFLVAPQAQRVALLRRDRIPYPNDQSDTGVRLVILEHDGAEKIFDAVASPQGDSWRWSADGGQFLVRDGGGRWWSIDAVQGRALALPASVRDCCFLGSKVLQLRDGWYLDSDQAILPASAQVFPTSTSALAVDGDKLYVLDAQGNTSSLSQLPGQGAVQVEKGDWPLVLRRGQHLSLVSQEGAVTSLPGRAGQVLAASAKTAWTVNAERTQAQGGDDQSRLQLSDLKLGEGSRLQSLSGGKDWLLLPVQGTGPYPTIVWLDPPTPRSDQPPLAALLSNRSGGLNANLLTAQGYAVFFPQMDAHSEAALRQVVQRLQGVTAVDSKRMAILGRGWGANCALLGASSKFPFQAVVAIEPRSDLGSHYAKLGLADKSPSEALLGFHRRSASYESSTSGLPWTDAPNYIKDSPYYQALQIEKPVLVFSGQDSSQAEQLFAALYRQRRPARLVSYPTRSNLLADQVVHQWHQIHLWLARYLIS